MGEGGRERERRKRAATTTMNNPSCFWVSTMYIKSQRSWVSLRKMEESLPKTAAKKVFVRGSNQLSSPQALPLCLLWLRLGRFLGQKLTLITPVRHSSSQEHLWLQHTSSPPTKRS
ncbi:uncharacterized protein LOC127808443 isoform X1 [Diospyros lotus]|uniref:uncharacterized protein LOC127808443 isoform X1 n=1 Tax=Diospyros lotus TaxID=55363 RepID=UPI00225317E6|nr:uncharacterized protein LOC127808443 isoform X1 [Diospyros lotus]